MKATFSTCGKYRYKLERQAEGDITTAIVMVNPSTADAVRNDPTIRKLIGFGNRYDWGKLIVGNLFAYRSTDVKELAYVEDPVGEANDDHLWRMFSKADQVIFAWGNINKLPPVLRPRWQAVALLCLKTGHKPLAIGPVTKDGYPCHPLMLPYSHQLALWDMSNVN